MGINFRIKDFSYPFSILQLKKTFDKNQWLSEEALSHYQLQRLKHIISHAYENIPYYHKLFKENKIIPSDIKNQYDLKHIPFLTKNLLKTNFASLVAHNAKKYKPTLLSTSGTTGSKINFYTDKASNILEFVYYWRLWGWAGYKLGDSFAELSAEFFAFFKKNTTALYHFSYLSRRLLVNSLLISHKNLDDFIGIFRRFKPLFLKGLPSNLYMLALLLNERKHHGISFKAVFSQGENLLPHQRELIKKVFSTKVYDSYGHMERTVAISQCPSDTYHIHVDYGLLELEDPEIPLVHPDTYEGFVKEIVGTSLYNLSMPLIRYRTGDLVKVGHYQETCVCKRIFPRIVALIGRDTDIIITPDGRAVTAIYTVFDHTPGVVMGQIIQDRIDRLVVKIVSKFNKPYHTDALVKRHIRSFVGKAMDIQIEHTTIDEIKKDAIGKFKVVVSLIPHEKILDI